MNYAYKDDRIYNILDEKLGDNPDTGKRDFFIGLFLFFLPNIILGIDILFF